MNLTVSLNDTNAWLALVQTGITHKQDNVDKIYTYLESLVTHTVSPLLISPLTLMESLENFKGGMAQHPQLALPNDPNQDI